MFRVLLLATCLAVLPVMGCGDGRESSTSFDVGPDGQYPIPGLGFDNRVLVSVRHVGI